MPEAKATCQCCRDVFIGEVSTPIERLRKIAARERVRVQEITGQPFADLLLAHHLASRPNGRWGGHTWFTAEVEGGGLSGLVEIKGGGESTASWDLPRVWLDLDPVQDIDDEA